MGSRLQGLCWSLIAALTLALPQAHAREVPATSDLRSPYDWTAADRRDWTERSARDNREQLEADLAEAKLSNTFVRSALANTQRLRASEYRTAAERHAYYDLMAQLLECSGDETLRGIRYFHSAAAVAGREAAGSAQSLPGQILGAEARSLLEDLQRALFRANFKVLRSLLFDWKAPRLPQAESAEDGEQVTPIVFDVAMVDREHELVERALAARGYPAEPIARINFFLGLNASIWSKRFAPVDVARRWTLRAGYGKEDFASRSWRVAMGRALVFFFHGFREQEHAEPLHAHAEVVRQEKHRM